MLSKIISAFICKALTKYFQRSLHVQNLTIRSYCHRTKKRQQRSRFRTQGRQELDQTGTDCEHCPQVRVQHRWLIMLGCRYCLSMARCHGVPVGLSLAPATTTSHPGGFLCQHISPASPTMALSSGQSCTSPSLPPQHQTLRI